jgi:hypothetical protein
MGFFFVARPCCIYVFDCASPRHFCHMPWRTSAGVFLFQQQRLKSPLTAAAYRRRRDSGTGFVRCARPRLSVRIPLSTHGPAAGVLFTRWQSNHC